MWRKICKAELQETRKVYFIMFAILLAAGILSLVVMGQTALYPWDTFSGTPEEFDVRSALSICSILGMYVLWIAAMVFYVVYTLYRFDRGMFGGEGVFWMTLPVKRREILAGKLVAPLVWGMVLAGVDAAFAGSLWHRQFFFGRHGCGHRDSSVYGAFADSHGGRQFVCPVLCPHGRAFASFSETSLFVGDSGCAGNFLHHRASVQCAGNVDFRCSHQLFPHGNAVPFDKRHCGVWFHCIDSHCHGIADTHLWSTDGVSGRKEIGLFRLRKVIPCSLITVYPFICRL
jgi:hypothetical protein